MDISRLAIGFGNESRARCQLNRWKRRSRPREVRGERQNDGKPDQRPEQDDRGGDAAAEGKSAASADEEAKKKRRPVVFIIGGVVLVLLGIGGLYYWLTTRNIESTDDAYTDGRAVTIAPQVSGVVVSLDVTDNQFVKQGPAADPYRSAAISDRRAGSGRGRAGDGARRSIAGQQSRRGDRAARIFPRSWSRPRRSSPTPQASPSQGRRPITTARRACPKLATTQQDVDAGDRRARAGARRR